MNERIIGPVLQLAITVAVLIGGIVLAVTLADDQAETASQAAAEVRVNAVDGCKRNVADRVEDITEAQREARYFGVVADHASTRPIRRAARLARRGALRQERSLSARVPRKQRPLKYRNLPGFTCARAYRVP